MKPIHAIALIAFLLLLSCALQGQTTQQKLNQVSLMKKWIGTWKSEIGRDTFEIQDIMPYGDAIVDDYSLVTKDKTFVSVKSVWGYDKTSDKFICASISKSSPDISFIAFWFTSETTCGEVYFKDISNPDKASIKWKYEFKSSDLVTSKYFKNNKLVYSEIYQKVKK